MLSFTNYFLMAIMAQAPPKPNPTMQFVILGLLFAGMWFLIIAPQRKRQKDHQKMITELKKGDEVVTSGGIYGVITNIKDDRFVVRIADNVKVELSKGSVQTKVQKAKSQ